LTIENNEMDEVAGVLDLMVKRAGANMEEYKLIRRIGSMASVEKKENWREKLRRLTEKRMMTVKR